MLSYMRENAGSWIIKILFAIIVVVFVFFYGFSDVRETGTKAVIAKVGGSSITMTQYQSAYKNTVEMYRSQLKGQFNEEMLEKLGLRQKVLENLIDREILLQEAEKRSIGVSEDDVKNAIVQTPMFQQDGRFSQARYERLLNYYGVTAAEFQQDKERELVLKALEAIVTGSVKVSEQELQDLYRMQREKVKISYVCLEPGSVKETAAVSQDEIKKYYDEHREEFRQPEKAKAAYIVFDPARYEKTAEVAEREIQEYYQVDTELYFEPKQVRARQILLKTDKKDGDDAVFKKAEALLEKINKGDDFEKLARAVSQDEATAGKGGDLGYFKKGDLIKPLEKAAFLLKKGQVSQPVKSGLGWHIIKVEDIKEARTRPLEEVRDKIEAEIRKEKAQLAAEKESRRAFNRLFKSRDLEGFARENGMEVKETGYFVFGAAEPDAAGKEVFSKEAFALEKGELSPSFAVGRQFYLLRLEDKRESQIAPLDEVKSDIAAALEKEKQFAAARVAAEKLLVDLAQGRQQWEPAAKAAGLKVKTASVSAAGDYIEGIGQSRELQQAAFNLSADKPYGKTPFKTDNGFAIIKFELRITPPEEDFAREKDRLAAMLLQTKRRELFEQYLQGLKAKADTWVDKKFSSAL